MSPDLPNSTMVNPHGVSCNHFSARRTPHRCGEHAIIVRDGFGYGRRVSRWSFSQRVPGASSSCLPTSWESWERGRCGRSPARCPSRAVWRRGSSPACGAASRRASSSCCRASMLRTPTPSMRAPPPSPGRTISGAPRPLPSTPTAPMTACATRASSPSAPRTPSSTACARARVPVPAWTPRTPTCP